jgi:hypothetical protein
MAAGVPAGYQSTLPVILALYLVEPFWLSADINTILILSIKDSQISPVWQESCCSAANFALIKLDALTP